MRFHRSLAGSRALALAPLILSLWARPGNADPASDPNALAVETLTRLQGVDLAANPKLHDAIVKLLARTRGTRHFVQLVQHFGLTNQNAGLLELAQARPGSQDGVEATRLLLAGDGTNWIASALHSTNAPVAIRTIEALGAVGAAGEGRAAGLLVPLLQDLKLAPAVRKQAVRALAKSAAGAKELLRLARERKLPEDLRFTAGTELTQAPWPGIKQEAAQVLTPATTRNAQPLPPVAELLAMTGDAAHGARVFFSPAPGCFNCHQVRGQGVDFGPNLSEIGTKLGKDAILNAILEPSAGISFGFEAVNFTLRSGDELSGFVAGETPEEVTVKTAGAILTRVKKSDITARQPSKLSIMPTDLQGSMTTQDLVDLLEYLASLKKP